MVDDPGTARPPDPAGAVHRHRGAPHPGDRPRHRRRLRQQGADLPRLRLRDRRLDGHRQAGEVDRGPHREPRRQRLRPRLRHAGRDRRDARGPDPGGAQPRARRPRRVQRGGDADEVPRRLLRGLHRQLRHRGRLLLDDRGAHQQGARRRRVRLLVPDRRGGLPRRADGRHPRRRARDRPGRAAARELHPARAVPLRQPHRLGLRLRELPRRDGRGAADRRVRRAPGRAGRAPCARRADGDRGRLLHRGRRRRAAQGHGPGRARDVRRLRAHDQPDRHRGGPDLGADPGPGPRDDVRPDRRRRRSASTPTTST